MGIWGYFIRGSGVRWYDFKDFQVPTLMHRAADASHDFTTLLHYPDTGANQSWVCPLSIWCLARTQAVFEFIVNEWGGWIGALRHFSTIFGYIWRSVSTAGGTKCSWEWTSNLPLETDNYLSWDSNPSWEGRVVSKRNALTTRPLSTILHCITVCMVSGHRIVPATPRLRRWLQTVHYITVAAII